jgi:serine/threonine protein kinase
VSRGTEPVLSGMSGKIAEYRLDGYIGRGSMAVVYIAHDERQDRTVALKVLAPEFARDAAFRNRFLHESRAAAAVDHPHIIPVYEADEAGGVLYLAMRYVQGGDARSLLNRLGPLPFGWASTIVTQVASALDAAHAHGLIHRDVKPGNILLDVAATAGPRTPRRPDGGDFDHVYLSDFGISKNAPPSETSAMSQFTGTLDYVAPEQIEGRAVDGRADLYSLACVAFELLCGTPPFGQDQGLTVMYAQLYAPPPMASARRPDLPAAADRVLARALAKNPADRYPGCAQFAEELQTALGHLADETDTPTSPPAPLPPPALAAPPGDAGPPRDEQGDTWQAGEPGAPPWQATQVGPPWQATQVGPPWQATPPAPPWQGTQAGPPWQAGEAGSPDVGYQAAEASAPTVYGPGWPSSPQGPSPADPERMGAARLGGPGRIYPVPPRRPAGRGRLILAGLAAAIVLAVVLAVALSGRSSAPPGSPAGSPAPSASTAAARQAAAVNKLLGSSADTRTVLVGAIREIRTCGRMFAAIARIRSVVNQRSAEVSHASALSVSALPRGAIVKSDLLAALRSSLDADRDYLIWARHQANFRCTPAAQPPAYQAALRADGQADGAKGVFVRAWNKIAARYGLPRKSSGDI